MSWTTITILALGLTPFSPAIKDGNPSASFIQFPADGTHATKTLAFGDATIDPRREKIVEIARLQIGLVNSGKPGELDTTGKKTRQGWQNILEYFHTAAPGIWSDEVVKYQKAGLPSWCGIFSLWAVKSAGLDVGNWRQGVGISGVSGIKQTSNPQPGDIAYIAKNQHHAIVAKVEGNTITTIDGNSGRMGGEITENKRSRSKFAGFYTAF
jgi:CHAP domain